MQAAAAAALSLLAIGASAGRLSGFSHQHTAQDALDIIVQLPQPVTSFENMHNLEASERRTLVGATLMQSTQVAQRRVIDLLRANNVEFEQFWITNTILVKNADRDLIDSLLRHEDVEEVRPDREIAHIDMPLVDNDYTYTMDASPMWPLKQINVPDAWTFTKGEGIVVANIDTGVRYTHVAVKTTYRGFNAATGDFEHNYNWFDPKKTQKVPTDNNGHGSHTMGNIAGTEESGFGVAPGAKWIAAKGCAGSSCSEADLTASAQFVLCPTRLDGSLPDCSKGANVVSNSWGGGRGNNWYAPYVNAWRAAGIIPVFSAGNSGPSCATANSPADLNTVISVGSTAESRALSSFSSRGPGVTTPGFSVQKPDISAPGEKVVSINYSSDTGTTSLSGTSMAAPHISGVVALVMSAFQSKFGRLPDYDEVYQILTTTAQSADLPKPSGTATQCSNVRYDSIPNFFYGWGIVDAAAAVKQVLN